jgi:hypothetical protein
VKRGKKDFWGTPAGVTVQVAAGFGVAISLAYIIKNWNQQSAGLTLPAASSVLLESVI